jgi:hypothetical protein
MPPFPKNIFRNVKKMSNNSAFIYSQPKRVCKVSPKTDTFCGLCKKSFVVYVKKIEIVM